MAKATVICYFRKTDSADLNRTKGHYAKVFESAVVELFELTLENYRERLEMDHCKHDGEIIVIHCMAITMH